MKIRRGLLYGNEPVPQSQIIDISWPRGGVVESLPEAGQPAGTSPDALNVRNFDALARRNRGGQRPGLVRHVPPAVNAGNAIQMLRTQTESVALSVSAGFDDKYADPVILPPAPASTSARAVVFHPDGDRVVVLSRSTGSSTLQCLTYEWSDLTGWGIQVQNTTLTGFGDGPVRRLSFSPDGTHLIIMGSTGTGVFPFSKTTGIGARIPFPVTTGIADTSTWADADWHPDGDQIFVSYNQVSTTKISVSAYAWTGTAFGAVVHTHTHSTFTTIAPHVSVAPDGLGVVSGGIGNIYTLAYDKTTGFSTERSVTESGGGVQFFRFHPDSTHVIYGKASAVRVRTYSPESGLGAPVEQTLAGTMSLSGPPVFSPNGDFVLASHITTPFISVFPWTGAFGAQVPNPVILPPDNATHAVWSPSGEVVASSHFDSPFVSAWPFQPSAVFPSARRQRIVAVSGGNIYLSSLNLSSWALVNGGLAALISSGDVMGTEAFQSMYFVDSTSGYKELRYSSNSVIAWTPTAGSLPVGSVDPTIGCRIIALYRGRVVLSGLLEEPHNWFMSKSGDPHDWDYSPATTSPIQAVAGNSSNVGELGDVVTALCPYQDDVLIMGGANSVWVMRGDPAAGGAIDNVTRQVGIAGKEAWTWDTAGTFYFFGENGLYRFAPGASQPDLISKGKLDKTLSDVDISESNIRLLYDAILQGVHIFITPASQPASPGRHYFWDERNDAFWVDEYPVDVGPTAVHRFVADDPEKSATLLGGWDSFVRAFKESATDDDGTNINSYVLFTPLQLGKMFAGSRIDDLHVVTAKGSGNVLLKIYTGESVEDARDNADADTVRVARTLVGGRNTPLRQRVAQNAMILRLGLNDGTTWAFEQAGMRGMILDRMRGKRVT